MIFNLLFNQYKRGKSKLFGSTWLNIHGRLLIGNPRDNGLEDVDPELQRSYYYLKEDRFSQPTDRLKFRQENMLLTVNREAERPRAALAASVLAMAACLAIAGVAGIKGLGDKAASSIKSSASGFSLGGIGGGESKCLADLRTYYAIQEDGGALTDEQSKSFDHCVKEHREAMKAELDHLRGGGQ